MTRAARASEHIDLATVADTQDTGRWEPDDQLIAAVRCGTGSRRMVELSEPDRCWVVAGLTLAGWTADDIKDRLKCSLRLVRSIRAAHMTQVCTLLQTETRHFAQQSELAESEARALRRDLAAAQEQADRLKGQLDRVIDARLVGQPVDTCGKGHLMINGNVYWHNGRRWCRTCHADRQRDYRLARKLDVPATLVRDARETGTLDEFIHSVLAGRSTMTGAQVTASVHPIATAAR